MIVRTLWLAGVMSLASILSACSGGSGGSGSSASQSPQAIADTITQAAYNGDQAGVTANFDDNLKTQVSPASVTSLSQGMRKLGTYSGLTLIGGDDAKREYTYRADFTKGSMNVVLRLDPNGQVAAYRAFPR